MKREKSKTVKKTTSIVLELGLLEKLDYFKNKDQCSRGSIVRRALRSYFEKADKEEKK